MFLLISRSGEGDSEIDELISSDSSTPRKSQSKIKSIISSSRTFFEEIEALRSQESKRIGCLIPHSNTTIEKEAWKIASLIPELSFHFWRLRIGAVSVPGQQGMLDSVEEGTRALAGIQPDLLVYGASLGSMMKGHNSDRELIEKMEQYSKKPFYTYKDADTKYKDSKEIQSYTSGTAVVDAFKKIGAKSVTINSPHIYEFDLIVKKFLEDLGYDVKLGKCLNIDDNLELGNLSPDVARELVMSGDVPGTDVDLILCANFGTLDVIEELEGKLGKPVVSVNLAMIWGSLRKLGMENRRQGFGTLLSNY